MTNSDDNKIDFAKFIIEHNSSLINLADTKAGILLGINGIILALLFGIEKSGLTPASIVLFIGTGTLLAASSFFSIITILPRLTKEQKETKIYFKKISEIERQDFINSWNNIKDSDILNDYLNNIHNLSIIQKSKFKNLQTSIIANIVGIILLAISLFVYLTNSF